MKFKDGRLVVPAYHNFTELDIVGLKRHSNKLGFLKINSSLDILVRKRFSKLGVSQIDGHYTETIGLQGTRSECDELQASILKLLNSKKPGQQSFLLGETLVT